MLVTIVTSQRSRTQILQIEALTVKDCLVAWAGKVDFPGLDDAGRTRLRGDMADFDGTPVPGFSNVWRLTAQPGPGDDEDATVVVVETAR
jgi:hypothetical protein